DVLPPGGASEVLPPLPGSAGRGSADRVPLLPGRIAGRLLARVRDPSRAVRHSLQLQRVVCAPTAPAVHVRLALRAPGPASTPFDVRLRAPPPPAPSVLARGSEAAVPAPADWLDAALRAPPAPVGHPAAHRHHVHLLHRDSPRAGGTGAGRRGGTGPAASQRGRREDPRAVRARQAV